jgi:hypothetical protein
LGIVLFGVFVSAPIPAAVFTVNNNTLDIPDAKQGEGICDSVPPLNVCTLRTASGCCSVLEWWSNFDRWGGLVQDIPLNRRSDYAY